MLGQDVCVCESTVPVYVWGLCVGIYVMYVCLHVCIIHVRMCVYCACLSVGIVHVGMCVSCMCLCAGAYGHQRPALGVLQMVSTLILRQGLSLPWNC